MIRRADALLRPMLWAGLWLFACVALLSIAAQNVFWIALVAWLGQRLWVQHRLPRLPRLGWFWVAFLGWALVASLHSDNAVHSLYTWRKWLLAVAAWCVADAIEDTTRLKGLLGTLLIAAALVNLGTALIFGSQPLWAWAHGEAWQQVSFHWVFDTQWRARGGSGGYMVLAALDALLLSFYGGLLAMDRAWRRPLVWACLASVALGLLLTMTRGAWIAALAGIGGLLLWRRPKWAAGLLATGLLLALLAPQSVFVRRMATVLDKDNDSNRERIYMAQVGLEIMQQKPWLGVGDALHSWEVPQATGAPVIVEGWFRRLRSPAALDWYRAKGILDKDNGHLHDTPLQLAAMYGLPGLALALAFFAGLAVWGLKAARDTSLNDQARGVGLGLAAGLVTLGVHSLTEYNLGSFQTSFTLWFVIGLAAAAIRLGRRERAR